MASLGVGKGLLCFRTIDIIAYCDGNDGNRLCAKISISDCIVCMVQLCAVVTKLGEVCFKWFILLGSAGTELAKYVLSADIRSSGVQAGFLCIPHLERVSHSLDDTPYFGGTGKSDHRRSFGFLSLPIIMVVIVVGVQGLRFRIISGDDCICSHG